MCTDEALVSAEGAGLGHAGGKEMSTWSSLNMMGGATGSSITLIKLVRFTTCSDHSNYLKIRASRRRRDPALEGGGAASAQSRYF